MITDIFLYHFDWHVWKEKNWFLFCFHIISIILIPNVSHRQHGFWIYLLSMVMIFTLVVVELFSDSVPDFLKDFFFLEFNIIFFINYSNLWLEFVIKFIVFIFKESTFISFSIAVLNDKKPSSNMAPESCLEWWFTAIFDWKPSLA